MRKYIYTHDELPIYVHVCIFFFVLSDYYYGHSLLTVAEVDDYLSVIIAEECAAIDIVIAVVHLSLHLLRKEFFL